MDYLTAELNHTLLAECWDSGSCLLLVGGRGVAGLNLGMTGVKCECLMEWTLMRSMQAHVLVQLGLSVPYSLDANGHS